MDKDEEYIAIGKVVGFFGNKGAVKVKSLTDNPKRFQNLKKAYIIFKNKEVKEVEINSVGKRKSQIILNIKGYNNISEAKSLKDCTLAILRSECPKLPKDSFYEFEIIGLKVFDTDNNYLGKVVDIYKTGSNDVYELDTDILLPAIKEVIKKVDLKKKEMIVNLMEGLT
jgi:16S rRNA processing protein RimM